jgi:tRNA dimethylallyltransferase
MPLPVSNPVVVILGPTAVGRRPSPLNWLSILTERSSLLIPGISIGAWMLEQPNPRRLREKGSPFQIDVVDPDESISMAVFQSDVYQYIDEIHQRKKIPFLVGGTGQYLWSVVEGWQPPRTKPNTRLREVLENLSAEIGAVDLFHYVELIDPKQLKRSRPIMSVDPSGRWRSSLAVENYSQNKKKESSPV